MLVLDTDHMTILFWNPESDDSLRLQQRLDQHPDEVPVTNIMTYEEQSRGWLAYVKRAKKRAQMIEAYELLAIHAKVYGRINILGLDDRAYSKYVELQRAKLGVGTQDLKIAAIALANDARLLSRNLKHFEKVPGLRVEDWTV